ncbi:MAG: NifU family protein [Rickettsiales bacterium]
MFIQTEETPNPQTLKFIPESTVMESGTAFFTDPKDATVSPLATELFSIDGVEAVFLGNDFITITKSENEDWESLKAPLLTCIMDFFVAKKPVMLSTEKNNISDSASNSEDDEISQQIRELIDTRVRPAVAQDGGDIIFRGFSDGIVSLEMHGSCSGCPSSTITLKNGVENMLKHYIPEVIAVEAVSA